MSREERHFYEFGQYRLDPVERLLLRSGEVVALTPKAFETLLALVENPRHVLTKEELMGRVWPDAFVEETNLAQNISTLRKALGEREDGGSYIETVPKRGYRFVVLVRRTQLELKDLSLAREPAPTTAEERSRATAGRSAQITAGMRLGRYEIISRLGTGGMGEVYLARDTELERRVALKLLPEPLTRDGRGLRRFVREARAASALSHPNILTVYEIREVGGRHFIVTEFIEGATLRERISRGPVKPLAALEIGVQAASALSAAHATGIVHRDIKPENIMVRPDGYVKVLDFGVAKLSAPDPDPESPTETGFQTDPGLIMGTLNYMSPEQARGLAIDARSDLFSLGVVLYEMLSGSAPFTGATRTDVLVNILDRTPESLTSRVEGLHPEIERIVERALAKDRARRYQTAEALLHDLKRIKQEIEFADHLAGAAESPTPSSGAMAGAAEVIRSRETRRLPEIRYARSGEVNIAYQVVGDGPIDLVFVMGWVSHLEYFWAEPSFARFLARLASFTRLILFDKRGTGLSDRVPHDELPTLEQRMEDVRAVLAAVGSPHAVLCGVSEGGPMSGLYAATYPEQVTALIMIGTYARRLWAPDYPWGMTEEGRARFLEEIRDQWGGPVGIEARAPSLAADAQFREWWATYLRMGASPGAALALTRMNAEIDVRHILPSIRVPTLVLHRTGDLCLKIDEGRHVASLIPGAKFVALPGADHLPFVGDQDEILDEIEDFLTGVRRAEVRDTMLATVLATRIKDPAAQITALGSGAWRDLLERHLEHVRREIELFKGREVELTGERLLATFDGPARAIRAACAVSDVASRLGIELQVGVHTGECDLIEGRVGGLAVEISEQIAACAEAGEVLVSRTVKDLVAGSGLRFAASGTRSLAGIGGDWPLFSVARR